MPLVKLGYLLIRTIAKPVSSGIKSYAQNHCRFRNCCIAVAQGYHRSEVKLRRGLQASRSKKASDGPAHSEGNPMIVNVAPEIKPLDPQKAVEIGANFLGELIVFSVASILLVADQLSSRRKEAERRAELDRRLLAIESDVNSLKAKQPK
jgi:hypothetical protein